MQFLNKAAGTLLNKLLGDYISNIDSGNVSFSLSGELTLHNLQLKSSALDKLGLPIKVKAGSISRLHLEVPWRDSRPAIVNIEGLYILACPSTRSSEDVRHLNLYCAQKELNTFYAPLFGVSGSYHSAISNLRVFLCNQRN
jgi:hypothetical protein